MKALIITLFSLEFESSISIQDISITDIGYSAVETTPSFFLYSENAAQIYFFDSMIQRMQDDTLESSVLF